MRTKYFIFSMAAAVILSMGFVGCKGNTNNPDDPQTETADAKYIGHHGSYYEIEMKDGTRLYFQRRQDYKDTPYYFALSNADEYYSGYSNQSEMAEQYAYSGKLTIPSSVTINTGNAKETYSVEGINGRACFAMKKLREVSLPTSIRFIDGEAFMGCSSLESINIPNGVTTLYWVFMNCSNLKNVNLPESIIDLPETFECCTSLETIELPSKLERMHSALYGCSSITALSIPQSVTTVGSLGGCTNLKEVKCYAVEPPSIGYNSESEWDNAVKFILYVPKGSISKYQNSYWGTDYFAKEIRPLD